MSMAAISATTEEIFTGTAGETLFYRSWLPTTPPKALIVLQHGFNSHSGQYGWAAQQFQAAGYAVYAGDLRGRGKSGGKRFYVNRFSDYVSDLGGVVDIARSRHPGLKVFVLGHSAGGVIAACYTRDNPEKVAGLISESLAYRLPAPTFVLDFLTFLSAFLPGASATKLNNAHFSRDPAVVAARKADPLIANEAQPIKTIGELWKANRSLEESFVRIMTPTLILHGTADKATLYTGSKDFYHDMGGLDKTLKLYRGYVHDLLADTGKETVMGDILDWLKRRV